MDKQQGKDSFRESLKKILDSLESSDAVMIVSMQDGKNACVRGALSGNLGDILEATALTLAGHIAPAVGVVNGYELWMAAFDKAVNDIIAQKASEHIKSRSERNGQEPGQKKERQEAKDNEESNQEPSETEE